MHTGTSNRAANSALERMAGSHSPENGFDVSGAYATQPASGAAPTSQLVLRKRPPTRHGREPGREAAGLGVGRRLDPEAPDAA